MGKSTEPLKTRQYLTAETLTVVRLNPILSCPILRNTPHFFVSTSAIPDNRCLTEWVLSVKHCLLPDKLLILNNLSVKPHLFTDKLSILSQLFTVIRFHGGEQDSLTPQKAKHPCRLTEVSEAEQLHRPLISIPLTLLFYWDSVPNPDTPCGLCVLHVFAVANTRTRPVV